MKKRAARRMLSPPETFFHPVRTLGHSSNSAKVLKPAGAWE